jgi:hypothetical protein
MLRISIPKDAKDKQKLMIDKIKESHPCFNILRTALGKQKLAVQRKKAGNNPPPLNPFTPPPYVVTYIIAIWGG